MGRAMAASVYDALSVARSIARDINFRMGGQPRVGKMNWRDVDAWEAIWHGLSAVLDACRNRDAALSQHAARILSRIRVAHAAGHYAEAARCICKLCRSISRLGWVDGQARQCLEIVLKNAEAAAKRIR